jgi:arsenate reductase-like glutaredoxin family protein
VNVVIDALHWLKKNNVLYQDIDIDAESITQPEIVDFSEPVESKNSNIEKVFQMMAVFPDPNEPKF